MIPLVKAELRKMFTVRSTYFILGLALLIEVIFAFYASGFKANQLAFDNPNYLASQVTSAITSLGLIASLVAIMLITHEYRYNTIMYTLTSSKSRTQVFAAKFIVITLFAVLFSLIYGWLSPLLVSLGANLHGLHVVNQHFDVWSLMWRAVFVGWGFVMFASILAISIRAQVGAIAAVFLVPSTVESLLGLLLKQNQVYLPFSSLNVVIGTNGATHTPITVTHAALVATAYMVFGLLVSWILFVRRDAN
jgi:ABC-type transport system involved in multi-copper enzyme maturation permease subunit